MARLKEINEMAEKAMRSIRVRASKDECMVILELAGVVDLLRERDAVQAELVRIQDAARCALKTFGARR